ncbi:hypothetical protein PTTG_28713 [Puccinia triticina 1-1 BBBD Race 1]|uniref:Cyclin N-terminal domain-containing protein n=1 Tax=Puccinia triticina (isolate 1-1 / race 1 (BBBD)) TaxID=630390 RepID=A0A180GA08_PUCT1|nr:hypothetical protein PTTG_28713 [Puccinia triticina 1-1 BBBD Race 1]
MAICFQPPTRHSSRLGGVAMATVGKEDENAGANLIGRQPAGKVLRARKDLASMATNGSTKAISVTSKASGVSTTNTRKRILDDRTNNVKMTSTASNANAKPTTKAAPLTRKNSNAAAKKPMMVLDELKPAEVSVKRTIKPIKKESSTRPVTRRASGADAQQHANLGDLAGPSGQGKAAASKPAANRRNALRLHKAAASTSTDNGLLEPYDAGHVAKKSGPAKPDDICKENLAEQNLAKQKPSKKDATRAGKSQLSHIQQQIAEQDWEDLDEGDEEDPLMVKEYVVEIYHYMKELEMQTLPDSQYMQRQVELTWKMRGVLVDWIIEVHSKFRLLPETLYLAINLMDRFLTKRSVALIKFQLVGVTALFLASKYEEVICPSVTNFLYMTGWRLRLRRDPEGRDLHARDAPMGPPLPQPVELSPPILHGDLDCRLPARSHPSLPPGGGVDLACQETARPGTLGRPNLRHYSGYDQAEILPTAQFMLDYILRSGCKNLGMGLDPNFVIQASYEGGNEHANLFKKYATRKFFRVSEIVRDWAVDRYTFETPTGYEWDKLEEWSSSSKTAKKRATAAGAQRAARRVQDFFDNEDDIDLEQDDDAELEDEDLDDDVPRGLHHDQPELSDEIEDDEY